MKTAIVLSIMVLMICTSPASAYVGPGSGLELLPFAFSLLAMMASAFLAVCLWPLYRLIRWLRGSKEAPPSPEQVINSNSEPEAQAREAQ